MAASDDKRPVNAGQIKEYLNDFTMVKIDVLFDNMSLSNKNDYINIDGFDTYDYIFVETAYDDGSARNVHAELIYPQMKNSSWRNTRYFYCASGNSDLSRLSIAVVGTQLRLQQSPSLASIYITRVTGIRTGGGQLLAKLLDALHLGEVE